MGEEDLKELRELVELLKASGVAEFDMERPELKVRLTFASAAQTAQASGAGAGAVDFAQLARMIAAGAPAGTPVPVPSADVAPVHALGAAGESGGVPSSAAAAGEPIDEDAGLHVVRSPLVGTFYDAASPGAEPFTKVGDRVSVGKVLCIVEAMKIMNEIESDAAGEVVKVYGRPGQPVEYGQKLFGVRV